jgi:hypothetical protein
MIDDLIKRFAETTPSGSAVNDIKALREDYLRLARGIEAVAPTNRELSLSLTKLEESLFWAIASLTRK